MANTINVTVNDTTQTVNVTISDGVLTSAGGGTFISGFNVVKGSGNVAGTIEVGDFISGWIGTVWVAGEVNTIPVNDVSDLDMALQGEIL